MMTDKFYGEGLDLSEEQTYETELTNFEKVGDFMTTFGQEVRDFPSLPCVTVQALRIELIEEELRELREAIAADNIVEVADALTDILYVVYGAGHAFGINLDNTFAEVHASNMSKLGEDGKPIFREDGKVLKGPAYFKPDLFSVLFSEFEPEQDPEALEIVSVTGRDDGLYDVVFRNGIGVETNAIAEYDEQSGYLNLR